MKKPLYFATILILIASCSGKNETESTNSNSLNFTVEIDTVQVDPGDDHFIYLSNYLNTASLSSDKKTLYNFNPTVPELEIIDLDDLSLKEVIKLENEGPAGIGAANSYIPMMDISDSGELFLNTWSYMVRLNPDKDQSSKFWFTADSLKGDPMTEKEKIFPEGQISDDGQFYFGSYGLLDNSNPKSGLAIVNLNTKELKKVPLDLFEKIDKFFIVFSTDGGGKMSIGESVYFLPMDDQVIISTSTFNEIYVLSLADGELDKKSFHSQLTDDEKKGNYQKTASSREELFELNKEKIKEVTFGNLYFDNKEEKFWRFSRSLDRTVGDSVAYQSVLTIFDKDLTQLHEEKVDFSAMSSLTFFKDGSLYSYINLEDELGFIRIKPTYDE